MSEVPAVENQENQKIERWTHSGHPFKTPLLDKLNSGVVVVEVRRRAD